MTESSNRKQPTRNRLAKRAWLKTLALPIMATLVGIGLKLFFGYQPVEALLNWSQSIWLLFANQQALNIWITDHPAIRFTMEWFAAPTLLFLLAFGIVKLPPACWLIDLLFPDPPAFVFTDLDAEREATMARLDRSSLPLIGRENELGGLIKLLDKSKIAHMFRWQTLSGPSGVGKTRLGIEWLEHAKAEGWDFGIVDPEDSELLKGWRARRPTALVIDEARSAWPELEKAIARLQSGSGKRRPVRVLVVAQLAPYAIGSAPEEIKGSEALPALTLPPLDDEKISDLAKALAIYGNRAEMIVRESGGRPRAAIILANSDDASDIASAMAAWAFHVIPELRSEEQAVDESLAVGVITSGLVGPFPTAQLQSVVTNFSVLPLLRFFPSARQEDLEATLPALLPEDLGQELALRLLPRLGAASRKALFSVLIEQSPVRIEKSLGNVWRDYPSLFDGVGQHGKDCASAIALRILQTAFDEQCPDRVEAARQSAGDFVNFIAKNERDNSELERHLSDITLLASSRPFDLDIRDAEACSACNGVRFYANVRDFIALERWGERLIALAEHSNFSQDAYIRQCEASAAALAIFAYSTVNDFVALERWGKRLITFTEHPDFSDNSDIRLSQANAAHNAILAYGKAQDFAALERWGTDLIALAEDPKFSGDEDIRFLEAQSAANAICSYGIAKDFESLEHWGARLSALAANPLFCNDANFRLEEAKSAYTAICFYGEAKDFVSVERWGACLIALVDSHLFSNNPDIRHCEAMGAVNAVRWYGDAKDFVALEPWAARLIAVAEHPDFSDNADIRLAEANGAAHAVSAYSETEDFASLERWGARFNSLAEHPVLSNNKLIREAEAAAAVNATVAYCIAKDCLALERWAKRLTALVEHPAFKACPDMRVNETSGAVHALIASKRSRPDIYAHWKRRLAVAALDFPYHSEIQTRAKDWGVNYLEQRDRGWPYGEGK